jgi:integrase
MTDLFDHLDDYLYLRRSLGHQLADAGRLLPWFVAYLDEIGAPAITVDNALAWVTQPEGDPSSSVWMRRMTAVRGFARHMSGIDPANQIPPLGLVTFKQRWRQPFVYSDADVVALMGEARRCVPSPLRAATFSTMIGLLAATGMRVGEVIGLGNTDIDWADDVITVRNTKFDKDRLVPVDRTTSDALDDYVQIRDWHVRTPTTVFFVSRNNTPVIYSDFSEQFRNFVRSSGVGADSPYPPRIHDLRHSFAVNTLVRWHRQGEDVGRLLPRLSTYLGHLTPGHTYWYLSASPELLSLAAARLEKRSHR